MGHHESGAVIARGLREFWPRGPRAFVQFGDATGDGHGIPPCGRAGVGPSATPGRYGAGGDHRPRRAWRGPRGGIHAGNGRNARAGCSPRVANLPALDELDCRRHQHFRALDWHPTTDGCRFSDDAAQTMAAPAAVGSGRTGRARHAAVTAHSLARSARVARAVVRTAFAGSAIGRQCGVTRDLRSWLSTSPQNGSAPSASSASDAATHVGRYIATVDHRRVRMVFGVYGLSHVMQVTRGRLTTHACSHRDDSPRRSSSRARKELADASQSSASAGWTGSSGNRQPCALKLFLRVISLTAPGSPCVRHCVRRFDGVAGCVESISELSVVTAVANARIVVAL